MALSELELALREHGVPLADGLSELEKIDTALEMEL